MCHLLNSVKCDDHYAKQLMVVFYLKSHNTKRKEGYINFESIIYELELCTD